MLLEEIIKNIESKYPLKLAYSWDNVGLLVGDIKEDVHKIMVSIEANENLINEAIENSVDLIITHHPFIFNKLSRVSTTDLKGRLIYKLINNNIAIYSMHTNFDIAYDGLSDYFLKKLGINKSQYLELSSKINLYKLAVYVPKDHAKSLRKVLFESGAGHIGKYSNCSFNIHGKGSFMPLEGSTPYIGSVNDLESVEEVKIETVLLEDIVDKVINTMIENHPYEDVAYDLYKLENNNTSYGIGRIAELDKIQTLEALSNKLKETLNMQHIRIVGNLSTNVSKIAVVTGSGVEFMDKAKKMGADVLITGDIKYHQAQDALDSNICLIDCGHYESECIFSEIMKEFISDICDIEVVCSNLDLNPFKTI